MICHETLEVLEDIVWLGELLLQSLSKTVLNHLFSVYVTNLLEDVSAKQTQFWSTFMGAKVDLMQSQTWKVCWQICQIIT